MHTDKTTDHTSSHPSRPPARAGAGSFKYARRLLSTMSDWSEATLDLLYPPVCGACAEPLFDVRDPVQGVLCPDCAASLLRMEEHCCPRCAAPPAQGQGASMVPRRAVCGDCLRLGPVFEAARAGWSYGGPLLEAVHCLKYDRQVHLARPLARLMLFGLSNLPPVDAVVPVPTHPEKLRERGFDHAACMGDEVASGLGLPVFHDALRRRRLTAPQARLGISGRLQNQRGSVEAGGRVRRRLAGRRVLLVDDVMTTGATANVCAKALLAAGARAVVVAVLARAG